MVQRCLVLVLLWCAAVLAVGAAPSESGKIRVQVLANGNLDVDASDVSALRAISAILTKSKGIQKLIFHAAAERKVLALELRNVSVEDALGLIGRATELRVDRRQDVYIVGPVAKGKKITAMIFIYNVLAVTREDGVESYDLGAMLRSIAWGKHK